MKWIYRYRLRHYLIDSIWVGPLAGLFAAMVTARTAYLLDSAAGLTMGHNPDAARTVLITLASAMFNFVVFLASALLIAVQLASAQLTPRIIGLVFRDPVTKVSMTLFMYTFTLSLAVVVRIGDTVPLLAVQLSVYCCIASLAVFLFMIDHIGKMVRPNKALRTVALLGRRVIETVYPRRITESRPATDVRAETTEKPVTCSVLSWSDGVILACDVEGVVALARRADCVLEAVPQIGDFVAKGNPLFHVHGDASRLPPDELRQTVAIGQERSMEQDPAFALRIIVDIACKALSPAINDPTTAVLAIDQLHHLLRTLGGRHLDDDRIRDAGGQLRLLYRTPGWGDFVKLSVTEIRQFGGRSIQVMRRLRAMIESLLTILPEERGEALRRELELLNSTAARSFVEPEDREMASSGDAQGMGGNGTVAGDGEHAGEKKPGRDVVGRVPEVSVRP